MGRGARPVKELSKIDCRGVDSYRSMTYISVMVGEELKRWREKLEMTQAELAKRLKVDVMTVSNWERDKRRIPEFLDLALREIERENK